VGALQARQQDEDLSPYGKVERRCRLVQHDEFGVAYERTRNADALLLAPAQGGRIAIGDDWIEFDFAQHVGDTLPAFVARHVAPMDDEGFLDDAADAPARVEGFIGLLEDHADAGTQFAHYSGLQRGDVGPVEQNASLVWPLQADEDSGES
jgi:hypothetical protein